MKPIALKEIEQALKLPVTSRQWRMANALKAACERLALHGLCVSCNGSGQDAGTCRDCKGTGKRWKNWQNALRMLGRS